MKAASLLLSATLLLGAAQGRAQSLFYGVSSADNTSSLYSINPSNGTATLIGGIGSDGMSSLAFGPGGVLYGFSNQTQHLITINRSTGAGTNVGGVGHNYSDMTFRSDGTLFGQSFLTLYQVDRTNAAETLIGTNGLSSGNGDAAAISSGGVLYFAVGDGTSISLYTESTADASLSLVGTTSSFPFSPIGNGPRLAAMDFDPATGVLWGLLNNGSSTSGTSYLVNINPSTAAITVIGPTTSGMDGLAILAIPEPSLAALIGGSVALAGAILRRRGKSS